MNSQEILKFCMERGLLLDAEILNLFNETTDLEAVKLIIEKIKGCTNKRIITKNILYENVNLKNVLLSLPQENQQSLEKLKIKLGLSIEISRESKVKKEQSEKQIGKQEQPTNKDLGNLNDIKILSSIPAFKGKPEVINFVKYFRSRFLTLKNMLENNHNHKLSNLISINKISGKKQNISIIGMVSDKRITKNNNMLLELEDLTGKIRALVNCNKPELYKEAEEIALDSVIGLKGIGNNEILFVNDIIFPDSMILKRKKSPFEEYALFIGDLHFGSKLFLEENFLKFIDYLNGKFSNSPETKDIKYLFVVGDLVTGIGNYPSQEKDLKIKDLEEQFARISNMLNKIRKDITIIISPGNHDGVRLMEPQPLLDEKYAWPIYDLKNVILTTNPAFLNIGAKKNFSGFNVLTYHGFSFPFYANTVPRLMLGKALNAPDKIMSFLLKNRHLAPTHSSVQYSPLDEDPLIIKDVPDIFVSAHSHKSAVSYYNNVLMISTSTWESKSDYQEKMGNIPDHCKVPMFNLKTRAIKILDFE